MVDEERLLRLAQRGDGDAFGRIYDLYINRIFKYCYRDLQHKPLAEDVTATTFEKAFCHIDRLEWRDAGSLRNWLYSIAHNEISKSRRREKWRSPLCWFALTKQAGAFNVEREIQLSERQRQLYRVLKKLKPRDREVIVLRCLEELSPDDVAVILGCSRANVDVRLTRAKERLRKIVLSTNHHYDTLTELIVEVEFNVS